MILASQLRANARQNLQGRWGTAALISLVFILISFLIGLLNIVPFLGGLAVALISTPIAYGLVATFIKFKRNETYKYTTFLSEGFANFGKVWTVTLWTALKLLPWIILLIIAIILIGFSVTLSLLYSSIAAFLSLIAFAAYITAIVMLVIKGFSYAMIYFILYDEPTLESKAIVEKSAVLMKNNKWRFFCLNISFIGWAFLSAFTFGIGALFLAPYIQLADIAFYEDLLDSNPIDVKPVEPKKEENNDNPIQEN